MFVPDTNILLSQLYFNKKIKEEKLYELQVE